MAKEGFILLHRKLKDSWLWNDPIRLKWWLDILLTVNHAPTKILVKGKLLECERGQSLQSLDTWASMWGVNKKTVYKFFELLEKDEKIVTKSETVTTRITVCNYDSYNNSGNGKGNGFDNVKETERKRTLDTNKEGLKNDNNNTKPNGLVFTEEEQKSFREFQKWMEENTPQVSKMKEPITIKQLFVLRGKLPDSRGRIISIPRKDVLDILETIENRTDYHKKYKSPYMCVRNWWLKEQNKNKQ